MPTLLEQYLKKGLGQIDSGCLGYLAQLDLLQRAEPKLARAMVAELKDQSESLKMIASENYSSLTTQLSMGNLLTDKYSEGVAGSRFYAGCEQVDEIETLGREKACELFGAEYAYVQPHSGADANMIAFWAILHQRIELPALDTLEKKSLYDLTDAEWANLRERLGNQKLLGMDYYSGGHLTHGYRYNVSGRMFESHAYSVDRNTHLLDYEALAKQVADLKPLILLAGYSSYPRKINFAKLREIADSVGAVLMVDMAHFAGLVAGKVFCGEYDPVPYADVVTTTTHKTLRGPRGGLILAKQGFAEALNKGCPLVIGGPLPHVMAAKVVSFIEATKPEFQSYAQNVVSNCQALAEALQTEGLTVQTGGTDNHLLLVDVTKVNGLNGKQAENALRLCGITMNRNSLPFDANGPWYTSGLRFGTAALTTRGLGPSEMAQIAQLIAKVLKSTKPTMLTQGKNAGQLSKIKYHIDDTVQQEVIGAIRDMLARYPLYPELDREILYSLL
ncbi:glycine hydroxymethyltransferase [Candidatus Haliotispira prima]|uniref:Serine hydroxymethyltransferase n=1 Tax=Candidatus Haliotispira prima TaxID=3034016 RepID=A0ABY8MHK6_9SPIO|nr:glycine hydroxymethyltransferase [Candidatus Haliotispira prima]